MDRTGLLKWQTEHIHDQWWHRSGNNILKAQFVFSLKKNINVNNIEAIVITGTTFNQQINTKPQHYHISKKQLMSINKNVDF